MENIRAYGAGLAGGQFDTNTFFRKPTVIFKSVSFILGAILWYCISKGGYHPLNGSVFQQMCLYGDSSSTCSFASALGFFSMVGAGALLYSDAKFETISSIPTRKRVVRTDLYVSACFTGIFIIAFFTFWGKLSSLETTEPISTGYAKFGILMALFSAITWGGASFFAWRRQEEGAADAFGNTGFEDNFGVISSEVQDGYGYGGSSEGVGSTSVVNNSYQSGGPPMMPPQNQQQPPANSFVASEGYGY